MNWNIAKKLFLAMIIIGIVPMLVFSFLTISGYQNLLEKQSQYIPQDKQIIEETQLNRKNIKIQTFLIFFLMAILVIFFSVILVRKFIHPIKKLTKGTEEIKKGNFSVRIKVASQDEFSELAGSFNEMASQMDNKIKQLQDSKKSIKKAYTDLKKERQTSERERHKVSSIISNFSDPVIMVDNSWKISLVNPSAQEVFGLKEGDKGKRVSRQNNRYFTFDSFRDIIDVPFTSEVTEKKRDILIEEVVIPSSNENNTATSKVKYNRGDIIYKVTTVPVCDENDNCFGNLKIFYDLTQEKMMDELKSEFISIAAHQLRTPLTAIKWAIRMVLNKEVGDINKDQKELLNQGYKSNEKVIKLINDMLNVSRIEEGRFGYSFDYHNLEEVVDSVAEDLRQEIKNKGINFHLQKPQKLPQIFMDKEKMELIIQNLLENAVKFTPEKGNIYLIVKGGKKKATIKVKDDGVGIPKKNQKNLFTKFFRAENAKKMEIGGTGLGLFIVKNVVEKHKGNIDFKSEEGKGTEFTVTIPLEKS